MDNVSEECWARIESLRHRVKAICLDADRDEAASVDAELIELREYVFAALRPRQTGHSSAP